jgi:hypothetical protein
LAPFKTDAYLDGSTFVRLGAAAMLIAGGSFLRQPIIGELSRARNKALLLSVLVAAGFTLFEIVDALKQLRTVPAPPTVQPFYYP